MTEAFTLKPTPDGGMTLQLNLAKTSFVVAVTPAEIADIKKRIEAWHQDAHRRNPAGISGDSAAYGRKEVLGLLMRRMAEVTPPGLMGAVAKQTIIKRTASGTRKPAAAAVKKPVPTKKPVPAKKPVAAASKTVDPAKLRTVVNALSVLTARRAKFVAATRTKTVTPNATPTSAETTAAKSWAVSYLGKAGFPTDLTPNPARPFWNQSAQVIAAKAASALNAATKSGAPAKIPPAKPFSLERNKLKAVETALKTITSRRAKFLAWQKKPGTPVTSADMKSATDWSREFAQKNGIPSTSAPHQFWDQTLPIITTKVSAVVKLAEAQGAPAKPPTALKPVVTRMDPKKIGIIRQGLRALAGRRSRFLAKGRGVPYTEAQDIAEGKKFAREAFIKAAIPVTYPVPGKKGLTQIAGWISVGQSTTSDPVTAFWAQDPSVIKQKVDDVLKVSEAEAPATLAPPVPGVRPPAPTSAPDAMSTPGASPGGGDAAPGDMPPGPGAPGDVEEAVGPPPGDMSQPTEPPAQIPGTLATADEPYPEPEAGDTSYASEPAGLSSEEVPGEVELPPGVAPEDMLPDQLPGNYEQVEEQAEDQPEYSAESFAPVTTDDTQEDYAASEPVAEADDYLPVTTDTQEEGQGDNMYGNIEIDAGPRVGAYEIGGRGGRKGRTINKGRYEQIVKRQALLIAAKRAKTQATPADYAAAKVIVDKKLAKKHVTVAGDHILGISDIMGAAYIMGAAERGSPVAKAAIKAAVVNARKGNPKAQKSIRAMKAVAQGKKRETDKKKKPGLFARYFRAVANHKSA